MGVYFLFTRLSPGEWVRSPPGQLLRDQVADCVRVHCPELTWIANVRMPGSESYLDLVEAPYGDAVLRLVVLIRRRGISQIEMQPALPGWPDDAVPGPEGHRPVHAGLGAQA